jgi:ribonucleoside-diphosphate reductase alpha chain
MEKISMIVEHPFSKSIRELRYSWDKDDRKETWEEIAERVVNNVLSVVEVSDEIKKEIYEVISTRKFIPGGRFLAQAGRPYHQTNNCFTLRAEDTRQGWGDLLGKATMALMSGGGIGVDYSSIRPNGSLLKSSGGHSSGPIPLINVVNEVGRGVMAGGKRRCLPVGTLVETGNGITPIENIKVGDTVKTTSGMREVTGTVNQGLQDTIIINTQNGYFECTPNHKVAIFDTTTTYKFVNAGDLEVGDRLVFSQDAGESGEQTTLPSWENEKSPHAYSATGILIPELDIDMAWMFGFFHGNGHVSITQFKPGKRNGRVSFSISKDCPDVLSKVKEQIERFGVNTHIREYSGYWTVNIPCVQLALYFLQFKHANETMDVPDFILKSTKEVRGAYLAGLFDADGSVKTRPVNLVTSVYSDYLQQVQILASSLGIATRFKISRKAMGKWQEMYVLDIVGGKQIKLAEEMIFKYAHKYSNFAKMRGCQYSYSFSPKILCKTFNPMPRCIKNLKADFSLEYIEKITGDNFNLLPVTVKSIEEGRHVDTYDIEVGSVKEFIVNGYVVHNSAIWAGLNWSHPDVQSFIVAKNWTPEVRKLKEKDYDFPASLDMTNISVILDKEFFTAYELESHPLHNQAKEVYWNVINRMLKTGEPGFSVDYANKEESLRNACTEITSDKDSDVCCLGSINLSQIKDIEELKKVTELGIIFLLAGTQYSDVPYEKIRTIREDYRRLGLGLMGIHEWLITHGYKYEENEEFASWLQVWKDTSNSSAKYWAGKFNFNTPVATRALAPNGSTAIAGGMTTGGLEPLYSTAYQRRYLTPDGWKKQYVVDYVAERLYEQGYDITEIEDAYQLSFDIERRIAFQAFVQKYVDNGISTTLNLPPYGSDGNDDAEFFGNTLLKYLPQLRGITVYPDGARGGQPLTPVDFKFAISKKGVVFEGNEDCAGGVCGV